MFHSFHETSGTLTEISSTVDIYTPVFGDTDLGNKSSGEMQETWQPPRTLLGINHFSGIYRERC